MDEKREKRENKLVNKKGMDYLLLQTKSFTWDNNQSPKVKSPVNSPKKWYSLGTQLPRNSYDSRNLC